MQGSNGNGIAIGLHMMSPKNLIGECLEMATTMLKELVEVFCANSRIELPFKKDQKTDLGGLIMYIVDPVRRDQVIQFFVKDDPNSQKHFIRSWLHELRSIRNAWAHWPSQSIDLRLANRAFDTLSLLYLGFQGSRQGELFQKIELFRKNLILMTAEQYRVQLQGPQQHRPFCS